MYEPARVVRTCLDPQKPVFSSFGGLKPTVAEERARSMGLDMRRVKWLESPMLADERGHLYNGEGAL